MWPDRDAALFARDDLVAVITEMSRQPKVKKFVLFGHSMGGFLIMEALRQLKLEGRGEVLTSSSSSSQRPISMPRFFRKQLTVIGPLKTPLTLFVSKDDKAVEDFQLSRRRTQRAGRLDVDDPVVEDAAARYGIRLSTSPRSRRTTGLAMTATPTSPPSARSSFPSNSATACRPDRPEPSFSTPQHP